jgi:hypothetical protein
MDVFIGWFKIIDRGTQFHAYIWDYRDNVEHVLLVFYRKKGINYMFMKIIRPQTNGKWNDDLKCTNNSGGLEDS